MKFYDNEESVIMENEKTDNEKNFYMAYYDFKEYETDFFESKEYEKLYIDLYKNKNFYIYNYGLKPKSIKLIKDKAYEFIISKTATIDRKIPYIKSNDSVFIQEFLTDSNYDKIDGENYTEFIKYMKKIIRKKDVTKLPIDWNLGNYRNATAHFLSPFTDDINLDIIRQIPYISSGFEMINENDELSPSVLVHEMTHALTNRHKGIIRNGLHNELLPIYMELVAAYESDKNDALLNSAIFHRIQSVKDDMLNMYQNNYKGYITYMEDTYIDSSLYAFALFEQYRKASNRGRKYITKEINKTLSGDRQLEDTLQTIGATEEEGSQIIRKYVKTLMK